MTDPLGPARWWRVESVGEHALVIQCTGRLDNTHLGRALRETPIAGRWVVLDVAAVPQFTRPELFLLALTRRRLRAHGAGLVLWHVRAQPRAVMNDSALSRLIETVEGPLDDWLCAHPKPATPRHAPTSARPNADHPLASVAVNARPDE